MAFRGGSVRAGRGLLVSSRRAASLPFMGSRSGLAGVRQMGRPGAAAWGGPAQPPLAWLSCPTGHRPPPPDAVRRPRVALLSTSPALDGPVTHLLRFNHYSLALYAKGIHCWLFKPFKCLFFCTKTLFSCRLQALPFDTIVPTQTSCLQANFAHPQRTSLPGQEGLEDMRT